MPACKLHKKLGMISCSFDESADLHECMLDNGMNACYHDASQKDRAEPVKPDGGPEGQKGNGDVRNSSY
jgi:hypothetical protein